MEAKEIVFGGDFVSPHWCSANLVDFKEWVGDALLAVNLEGATLKESGVRSDGRSKVKYNIASGPAALDIFDARRTIFSVGNNHFEDFRKTERVDLSTTKFLVAGTQNRDSVNVKIGGVDVSILCLSFPTTDPWRWRLRREALLMRPTAVLRRISQIKRDNAAARIVLFVHWGFEFSTLPFPADRAWVRRAIDAGVDLIIGHHPHIIQPIERFGSVEVVYSLGNLYFPEGEWFGKALTFQGGADEGLVVRYDGSNIRPAISRADYERRDISVTELGAAGIDALIAPFSGMSDAEYRSYFAGALKGGHARAPSGIPLSMGYDTAMKEELFLSALDMRQCIRDILVATGIRNPYRQFSMARGG